MKFGDNLKKIRKNKKMSQEELAEKVNVSRQSVSKWETGDAYPEMNNILELCKIFNCRINDLVHSDMSDISSLDEEIIMNVVKFNEKKQNQVKNLSNVISLIGKIGSIVLMVAIPFVLLFMVLVPYVVNNVEVVESEITFKTENIKIIDGDKLEIFDFIVGEIENDRDFPKEEIISIIENNSKAELICYLEAAAVFILVDVILVIVILKRVSKLFMNIKEEATPFTLDNVKLIKTISYLMIALILVSPISGAIFGSLIGVTIEDNVLDLMSILEILIIFSMSYIFEYGYEIQKDSKGIMYNTEEK